MREFIFDKNVDRDIVRKILAQGSTITTAGIMIGNEAFLKRTMNKKNIGLEDFDAEGIRSRGASMTYKDNSLLAKKRDSDEANLKFNLSVAKEVEKLNIAGFLLGDIDYDEVEKIARLTMLFRDEDSDTVRSVVLTFIDIKKDLPGLRDSDENIIMLDSSNDNNDESLISSIRNKQNSLFEHYASDDKFVTIVNKVGNDKYYEVLNDTAFYSTPSFYKKTHFGRMLKNVKDLDAGSQLSEKYINALEGQKEDYHFIYEGEITWIDETFFTEDKILEFDDELIGDPRFAGKQTEKYSVLERHYNAYGKLNDPTVDEIFDKMVSRDGTFSEEMLKFAIDYFKESDIEDKKSEVDEDNEGKENPEDKKIFDGVHPDLDETLENTITDVNDQDVSNEVAPEDDTHEQANPEDTTQEDTDHDDDGNTGINEKYQHFMDNLSEDVVQNESNFRS